MMVDFSLSSYQRYSQGGLPTWHQPPDIATEMKPRATLFLTKLTTEEEKLSNYFILDNSNYFKK